MTKRLFTVRMKTTTTLWWRWATTRSMYLAITSISPPTAGWADASPWRTSKEGFPLLGIYVEGSWWARCDIFSPVFSYGSTVATTQRSPANILLNEQIRIRINNNPFVLFIILTNWMYFWWPIRSTPLPRPTLFNRLPYLLGMCCCWNWRGRPSPWIDIYSGITWIIRLLLLILLMRTWCTHKNQRLEAKIYLVIWCIRIHTPNYAVHFTHIPIAAIAARQAVIDVALRSPRMYLIILWWCSRCSPPCRSHETQADVQPCQQTNDNHNAEKVSQILLYGQLPLPHIHGGGDEYVPSRCQMIICTLVWTQFLFQSLLDNCTFVAC